MFYSKQLLIIPIVWLLIDCISASCVSNDTYCLTGSPNHEINGEYVHHSNCEVFRHLTANETYWLYFDSYNRWIINYNITDGYLDSIASCNQLLLDDCIQGKWYLKQYKSLSISIELCDSTPMSTPMPTWKPYWSNWTRRPIQQRKPHKFTPSPTRYYSSTSQDSSSAVGPIMIVISVTLIIMFVVLILRCAARQQPTKQINNSNPIHKSENDILMVAADNSHANKISNSAKEGDIYVVETDVLPEYKNIVPSAPENIIIETECEGIVSGNDKCYDIKEWFNSEVNLPEYNERYFYAFIANGYDEFSLIKEISETHLIKMGITKLAHIHRILNAIQNIHINDE